MENNFNPLLRIDFTSLLKNSNFDWDKVEVEKEVAVNMLDYPFEVNPEDFLLFAKQDIEVNDKRSLINALSNAKRAIDCITEKILKIFKIKPKRDNFKSKLLLLQDIGLVAPKIISRAVQIRNYLEHQFKLPREDQVKDAIDIATLFISSINGMLKGFWTDFYLIDENSKVSDSIYFSFDESKKQWNITLFKDKNSYDTNLRSR